MRQIQNDRITLNNLGIPYVKCRNINSSSYTVIKDEYDDTMSFSYLDNPTYGSNYGLNTNFVGDKFNMKLNVSAVTLTQEIKIGLGTNTDKITNFLIGFMGDNLDLGVLNTWTYNSQKLFVESVLSLINKEVLQAELRKRNLDDYLEAEANEN